MSNWLENHRREFALPTPIKLTVEFATEADRAQFTSMLSNSWEQEMMEDSEAGYYLSFLYQDAEGKPMADRVKVVRVMETGE